MSLLIALAFIVTVLALSLALWSAFVSNDNQDQMKPIPYTERDMIPIKLRWIAYAVIYIPASGAIAYRVFLSIIN